VLPSGWEARLIRVENANTRGAAGLCLEVHDLLLAKYVPGREKDARFSRAAVSAGLVRREVLEERLATMTLDERVRSAVASRIEADFAASKPL
jgi:hypothetical protein